MDSTAYLAVIALWKAVSPVLPVVFFRYRCPLGYLLLHVGLKCCYAVLSNLGPLG